jgi:hypothetical protein
MKKTVVAAVMAIGVVGAGGLARLAEANGTAGWALADVSTLSGDVRLSNLPAALLNGPVKVRFSGTLTQTTVEAAAIPAGTNVAYYGIDGLPDQSGELLAWVDCDDDNDLDVGEPRSLVASIVMGGSPVVANLEIDGLGRWGWPLTPFTIDGTRQWGWGQDPGPTLTNGVLSDRFEFNEAPGHIVVTFAQPQAAIGVAFFSLWQADGQNYITSYRVVGVRPSGEEVALTDVLTAGPARWNEATWTPVVLKSIKICYLSVSYFAPSIAELKVKLDWVDPDGDGLPDWFELLHFKSTEGDFTRDFDRDGLTDGDELAAGTNPTLADTDGDGSRDGDEARMGTNPVDPADYPLSLDVGRAIRLSWMSHSNTSYRVERCSDLSLQDWTPVVTMAGTGAAMEVYQPAEGGGAFFRLVEVK